MFPFTNLVYFILSAPSRISIFVNHSMYSDKKYSDWKIFYVDFPKIIKNVNFLIKIGGEKLQENIEMIRMI